MVSMLKCVLSQSVCTALRMFSITDKRGVTESTEWKLTKTNHQSSLCLTVGTHKNN